MMKLAFCENFAILCLNLDKKHIFLEAIQILVYLF